VIQDNAVKPMQNFVAGLASGMMNSRKLFDCTPQISGSPWGPESYRMPFQRYENMAKRLK